MILNSAQNIVDFVKSRGLPSDFDSRKKLFIASGLTPEGDEYRGTSKENPDLLNYLASQEKARGVQISPQNVYDVIKAGGGTYGGSLVSGGTFGGSLVSKVGITPTVTGIPPTTTATGGTSYNASVITTQPPAQITTQPPIEYPTPEQLGIPSGQPPENAAQLAMEQLTGGLTYPLQKEASEAEKATATLKGQQEKESLISKLASAGLFFSGKREVGLKTIDAETLATTFGIDRKFALLMAQGLESGIQQIAKEAAKGQTDAINALEAAGYTVVAGQVVPTLAREKAEQPVEDKLLSPAEAATLGVPYGTTEKQAATMGITPQRYKEPAEKTVPFSQWAAGLGIVGQPLEVGLAVAMAEAQNEKKSEKERQLASVRTNLYEYIRNVQAKIKGLPTREQLLEQLVSNHPNLTREEIATELYGLTKVLEPKKK